MVKRIFMQMTTCNNVFIRIQRGLDQVEAGWNTLKVVQLIVSFVWNENSVKELLEEVVTLNLQLAVDVVK